MRKSKRIEAMKRSFDEERRLLADRLVTGTLRTHAPSKWRMVDLETGEVWKLERSGRFVPADDLVFYPKAQPETVEASEVVPFDSRRSAIQHANQLTRVTEQQHVARKSEAGWIVKNQVTGHFFGQSGKLPSPTA